MKRTSRVLAAVVATTALTFTGVHTADAKPAHAGTKAKAAKSEKAKGGKGALTKLERDVARKVAQLEKTVSDQRLRRVDSAHAETVVANVDADQAALEALVAPADTTTEAAPATDVRATLKTYRPENYRLAVNILRQAAKAGETTEAETTEAETVAVDESVALALALTATSTKADVKAARAAFLEAGELLEDDADEAEEAELETPEGDETAEDTTTPEGGETVTP